MEFDVHTGFTGGRGGTVTTWENSLRTGLCGGVELSIGLCAPARAATNV